MPGTTSFGWPYAVAADATANFPATSRALADKLEAQPKMFYWRATVTFDAAGKGVTPFKAFTGGATPTAVFVHAGNAYLGATAITASTDQIAVRCQKENGQPLPGAVSFGILAVMA